MDIAKKSKKPVKTNISKQYELSSSDLRFLKVVDNIIAKNLKLNAKPNSDNSISKAVFGDRNVIAKVRASHRGISFHHLEKFAIFFQLDFNCFIRDVENVEYDTEGKQGSVIAKENAQIIQGNNIRNVQTEGGSYAENAYHGILEKQIQFAKKIINTGNCSAKIQEQCYEVLEQIQEESNKMELRLDKNTAELKKITNLLTKETEKNQGLVIELNLSKEKELEIMRKYTLLLEKKM